MVTPGSFCVGQALLSLNWKNRNIIPRNQLNVFRRVNQRPMGNSYLEYEHKGIRLRISLQTGDTCRLDRSNLSAAKLSDDPTVSLRHAIVQCMDDDGFYLTDLNSRNGTMLNGRPIKVPTQLASGDVIKVGTCDLVFHKECKRTAGVLDAMELSSTRLVVSSKLITVLVIDIRGYTDLTLRLGESLIGEILGTLFREAGRVLSSNHSWGQKYIGDAVMGVWIHEGQLPTRREFQLVLRSVVGIKKVFATINSRSDVTVPIRFGTGINTGYAAIGNMGSRSSPDYTALGDSVNKAFRLESVTRELNADIVLGSLTYQMLSSAINSQADASKRSVHLKGYQHPEEVYVTGFATIDRVLQSLERPDIEKRV